MLTHNTNLSILDKYKHISRCITNNEPFTITLLDHNRKPILLRSYSEIESELLKVSSLILILQIIGENLLSGKITTKRDIYYNNVDMFGNQDFTNRLIDKISTSLQKLLPQLNIYPCQKGLMFDCSMKEPILIPIKYKLSANINLVVVIEKDAIFKSFCDFLSNRSNELENVLVITGKGFPDFLVRNFVKYLANLNLPIVGFMDSDVYGLHIFKTFMIFHDANKYQNFKLSGTFLLDFNLSELNCLKSRDMKLMMRLIDWINHNEFNGSKVWIRELQRGMVLYKKGEMELVTDNHTIDSNNYLLHKVQHYYEQKVNWKSDKARQPFDITSIYASSTRESFKGSELFEDAQVDDTLTDESNDTIDTLFAS